MDNPTFVVVQKEDNRTLNSIRTFCGVMLASILCMHAISTYKDFKKKYKGE